MGKILMETRNKLRRELGLPIEVGQTNAPEPTAAAGTTDSTPSHPPATTDQLVAMPVLTKHMNRMLRKPTRGTGRILPLNH